jgi:hypothetical protein
MVGIKMFKSSAERWSLVIRGFEYESNTIYSNSDQYYEDFPADQLLRNKEMTD